MGGFEITAVLEERPNQHFEGGNRRLVAAGEQTPQHSNTTDTAVHIM